jgi:hypothetical protein
MLAASKLITYTILLKGLKAIYNPSTGAYPNHHQPAKPTFLQIPLSEIENLKTMMEWVYDLNIIGLECLKQLLRI